MFGWLKKNKSKKNPIEDESQELSPRSKPPQPPEAFNKWIMREPDDSIKKKNRRK